MMKRQYCISFVLRLQYDLFYSMFQRLLQAGPSGSCLSGRPLNPTLLAVLIQKKVIEISLYYGPYELSLTCFSLQRKERVQTDLHFGRRDEIQSRQKLHSLQAAILCLIRPNHKGISSLVGKIHTVLKVSPFIPAACNEKYPVTLT